MIVNIIHSTQGTCKRQTDKQIQENGKFGEYSGKLVKNGLIR